MTAGCLLAAAPASAQVTKFAVSTAGVGANSASSGASISADGRFVVFESSASNLVDGDTNQVSDVFLRDRDTDADGVFDEPGAVSTTRVSMGQNGVQGNYHSGQATISADGRYVTFRSGASTLLPDENFGANDLFRWDRHTGTLIRVLVDIGLSDYEVSANGNVILTGMVLRDLVAGTTTTLPPAYTPAPGVSARGDCEPHVAVAVAGRHPRQLPRPDHFFPRLASGAVPVPRFDRSTQAWTPVVHPEFMNNGLPQMRLSSVPRCFPCLAASLVASWRPGPN